jgi:hypothetical protein
MQKNCHFHFKNVMKEDISCKTRNVVLLFVLLTFVRYVAITAEEMKNILSSVNKQPPVLSGIDLLKEVCRYSAQA